MKDKEKLLEKYYEGTTTLEEEKQLRNLLSKEVGSADGIFMSDLKAMQPSTSEQPKDLRQIIIPVITVMSAACVALLLWFQLPDQEQHKNDNISDITRSIVIEQHINGEIEDPELALKQAKKALEFVSSKMNTGTKNMEHLNKLNQVK